MKRLTTMLSGAVSAVLLSLGTAPAASAAAGEAAAGEVVVYTAEIVPLDVFVNPQGCYAVPDGAHVLINRTDQPVQVYAAPECFGAPVLTIEKNWGSHVPPAAASFRV